MKKTILIIAILLLIVVLVLILSACNYHVFDFEYTFTNAYVKINETWVDLEVVRWCDYEGEQIQLTLTDGTIMVVHSLNCILYNGTLPQP